MSAGGVSKHKPAAYASRFGDEEQPTPYMVMIECWLKGTLGIDSLLGAPPLRVFLLHAQQGGPVTWCAEHGLLSQSELVQTQRQAIDLLREHVRTEHPHHLWIAT